MGSSETSKLQLAKDRVDHVGTIVDGRYEVIELIARGGMGAVYRALNLDSEQLVALKILTVEPEDQQFRRRFFNEAAMAATLTDRAAVRVMDYGAADDGTCFIVMELLRGLALDQYMRIHGALHPNDALRITSQITQVLMEAHAAGFVHRDIKPSNLLIEHTGGGIEVKVLDFGLAKRVERPVHAQEAMLGSPRYMSPEQLHGSRCGPPSDIYNVGLVMFYMLTHVHTFDGETVSNVLVAQATQTPRKLADVNPNLKNRPILEFIVRTCLEKSPHARFTTATELARAIDIALEVDRGERPTPNMQLVSGRLQVTEPDPAVSPVTIALAATVIFLLAVIVLLLIQS